MFRDACRETRRNLTEWRVHRTDTIQTLLSASKRGNEPSNCGSDN